MLLQRLRLNPSRQSTDVKAWEDIIVAPRRDIWQGYEMIACGSIRYLADLNVSVDFLPLVLNRVFLQLFHLCVLNVFRQTKITA